MKETVGPTPQTEPEQAAKKGLDAAGWARACGAGPRGCPAGAAGASRPRSHEEKGRETHPSSCSGSHSSSGTVTAAVPVGPRRRTGWHGPLRGASLPGHGWALSLAPGAFQGGQAQEWGSPRR